MKLNDMFPSKYVKGEDLGGKSFVVTIARVVVEKMRPNPGRPEEEKFVLYTVEGHKGIILSKTIAGQIAQITGSDDSDHWPGKKIEVYPESVTVGGVPRVAVRAKAAN
jgi:hypothetical protein